MNNFLLCGESSSPIHQKAYRGEATSVSLNVLFPPPPALQRHEGLGLLMILLYRSLSCIVLPSLPADTMMSSSQGTSVSSISFSRWASHDKFLSKYHFLLHILRFLFFFSYNIMADVSSKQQTTALFLSTIVTHRTDIKTDKPDGKPMLCQRTFSSVFCAVFFFTQLNCTI